MPPIEGPPHVLSFFKVLLYNIHCCLGAKCAWISPLVIIVGKCGCLVSIGIWKNLSVYVKAKESLCFPTPISHQQCRPFQFGFNSARQQMYLALHLTLPLESTWQAMAAHGSVSMSKHSPSKAMEIARQQPDLVLSQRRLWWYKFCRPWSYSSFLITCRVQWAATCEKALWNLIVMGVKVLVWPSVIVAPFRCVSKGLIEIIVSVFRRSAHWCDSHAWWPSNSEKTPGAWLTQTICHTTWGKTGICRECCTALLKWGKHLAK